jgi:hypothetical protein
MSCALSVISRTVSWSITGASTRTGAAWTERSNGMLQVSSELPSAADPRRKPRRSSGNGTTEIILHIVPLILGRMPIGRNRHQSRCASRRRLPAQLTRSCAAKTKTVNRPSTMPLTDRFLLKAEEARFSLARPSVPCFHQLLKQRGVGFRLSGSLGLDPALASGMD